MGLDSVEIVMKVEKEFGIALSNHDVEKVSTVGDFHEQVWKHVSGRGNDRCASQRMFYMLRKSFSAHFNFPAHRLQTDTSPEAIFPVKNRRRLYADFAQTLTLEMPALELPKSLSLLLQSFACAVILGGLFLSMVLIMYFDQSWWSLLIPVAGAMLTDIFSDLLNPQRMTIKAKTVKKFIEHTLALNYAMLSTIAINRREMEMVINHIIAEIAGIEVEEVLPHKKITDDLGID